jgi:hypothetical protein
MSIGSVPGAAGRGAAAPPALQNARPASTSSRRRVLEGLGGDAAMDL